MTDLKILHNPRCSKSRQTLKLLNQKGLEPHIIEYLKTPISAKELKLIINQLGFSSPRQLMRKGENAYKQQMQGRICNYAKTFMLTEPSAKT